MKTYFADTNYWIARINKNDTLHPKAREIDSKIRGSTIVTSEMVLTEVMNGLAKKGEYLRNLVCQFIQALRKNKQTVVIVEQTSLMFSEAFQEYLKHSDKKWGLTDCSSFLIMKQNSITEALTHDRDFEQAGFTALMKN